MPSQTPMEAARTELRDKMKSTLCQASDDGHPFCAAENSISSRPCYCEAAVHIAITAYLAALPEDKETVERVARGICEEVSGPPDDMDAWEYDPAGPVNRQLKKAPLWTKQVDAAKAALAALTATGR